MKKTLYTMLMAIVFTMLLLMVTGCNSSSNPVEPARPVTENDEGPNELSGEARSDEGIIRYKDRIAVKFKNAELVKQLNHYIYEAKEQSEPKNELGEALFHIEIDQKSFVIYEKGMSVDRSLYAVEEISEFFSSLLSAFADLQQLDLSGLQLEHTRLFFRD